MKKVLFFLLLMLFLTGNVSAISVLDFEDLSGSGNIDSAYQNLAWDTKWIHSENAPSYQGSYLYFSYHPMEGT